MSVRSFISFLCRWFPASQIKCSFWLPVLACCLKDCVEDVAERISDRLKMNDDKTELMAIGTRSKLSQAIPNRSPMSISGCDIPFSQSVRHLGFCLDENCQWMHILNTCFTVRSVSCAELEKISSFQSTDAANKLAVSLILSRLDYCNSLPAGIMKTNWINCKACKIMQSDLSSIHQGFQVQQHCSEHSTGFQWSLEFYTKLLVSVFSVSIKTVCHHIFLPSTSMLCL